VLLEVGMRPDVDYKIHFSHGQKRSILGLVAGDFELTALSDDKLQSMLKNGSVRASDYRVIYESPVIPRLTFGYVHRLQPELAAMVTAAALEFANADAPADETTGKPMRFLAIDYKKDFDFVRRIDDSFDPRFGKTSKVRLTP
jgi:phosphonate transport system substrate-binding protein